jgi:SAM-dependent methyltransferase
MLRMAAMSSPNGPLGGYYDRLSRYNAFARFVGRDGGQGRATVHRFLRPDDPATDPADTVHELIAARVADRPPSRIFDAGCGLGGTALWLAGRFGASADGVTLSARQAELANVEAARRGLGTRCRFRVASYDDALPAGRYDLIVAVESLAHSPDPAASLANLARGLARGGRIAVVDDVRARTADARDAAAFVAGWQAPGFLTQARWHAAFAAAGLRVEHDEDLTPRMARRPAFARELLAALNRMATVVPHAGWRAVLASHRGGLALERLYARGGASYRLFAAV